MALQQSLSATTNLNTQVIFPKAYVKVEKVTGNCALLEINLAIYTAKNEILIENKKYLHTPDAEGGNFVKQAYEFLKTLPEFSDAVDC